MGRKSKPRLDQSIWNDIGERNFEDMSNEELLSVFEKFVRAYKNNPPLHGVRAFKNRVRNIILERMRKKPKKK